MKVSKYTGKYIEKAEPPYYGADYIDRFINDNYIKNRKNGFFVECGAYDGIAESTCKYFEDQLGWTGINIEPLPNPYSELIKNRPKCINLNLALFDHDGVINFCKSGLWGGPGSINQVPYYKVNEKQKVPTKKFNIECKKFSSVWNELKLDKEIDIFVLDIEGFELYCIPDILTINPLPKIFCIEWPLVGIEAINKILDKYYKIDKIIGHNALYLRSSTYET